MPCFDSLAALLLLYIPWLGSFEESGGSRVLVFHVCLTLDFYMCSVSLPNFCVG